MPYSEGLPEGETGIGILFYPSDAVPTPSPGSSKATYLGPYYL